MQDTDTVAALERSLLAADAVMLVYPALDEAADNPMGNVIIAHGTKFGGVWSRGGDLASSRRPRSASA